MVHCFNNPLFLLTFALLSCPPPPLVIRSFFSLSSSFSPCLRFRDFSFFSTYSHFSSYQPMTDPLPLSEDRTPPMPFFPSFPPPPPSPFPPRLLSLPPLFVGTHPPLCTPLLARSSAVKSTPFVSFYLSTFFGPPLTVFFLNYGWRRLSRSRSSTILLVPPGPFDAQVSSSIYPGTVTQSKFCTLLTVLGGFSFSMARNAP